MMLIYNSKKIRKKKMAKDKKELKCLLRPLKIVISNNQDKYNTPSKVYELRVFLFFIFNFKKKKN